jgi:hypothetical protein
MTKKNTERKKRLWLKRRKRGNMRKNTTNITREFKKQSIIKNIIKNNTEASLFQPRDVMIRKSAAAPAVPPWRARRAKQA